MSDNRCDAMVSILLRRGANASSWCCDVDDEWVVVCQCSDDDFISRISCCAVMILVLKRAVVIM